MNRTSILAAFLAAATLAAPVTAGAADLFPAYFGRWVIAAAQPAPWVAPGQSAPADDGLVGKSITYTPDRILGPKPLRCSRPDYELVDLPPEGLFQGNLTQPAAQARALGFAAGAIRTLQTGCEGFIDFHFAADGTVRFALNNLIYTLQKDERRRAR